MMEFNWNLIESLKLELTHRAKVAGGWWVIISSEDKCTFIKDIITFIDDKNHVWES